MPIGTDKVTDNYLSRRTCLWVASAFWIYFALTTAARWELRRRGSGLVGGSNVNLALITCLLLWPPLLLLTMASYRVGYDLRRWCKMSLANFLLATVFGMMSYPLWLTVVGWMGTDTMVEVWRKFAENGWVRMSQVIGASAIEDGAQYIVLQALLVGGDYYAKLKQQEATHRELAEQFARAQLQALRMQTNPHFLFNTLSAIAGLIKTRPDAAALMITRLGEILRNTLQNRNVEFVALADEIALGRQYLDIQALRFEARFSFATEVAPDVQNAAIPPLLLQPLLENAVEYGLTGSDGSVHIAVDCRLASTTVQIQITNRVDPDSLIKRRPHHGIGLELVRSRLSAAFGAIARLEAQQDAEGYFHARLGFPYRRVTAAGRSLRAA